MNLDRLKRATLLEVAVWVDAVAGAPAAVREALGLRAVPVAGGIALICEALSTLRYNRAFGFGLEAPFGAADLAAIAELYPRAPVRH